WRDTGHTSFDPDLFVERRPIETERGPGVLGQLATLTAVVVGEEHESARVGAAKEDQPCRWLATGIRRRENDWRRVDLVCLCALDGIEELGDRIGTCHPAILYGFAFGSHARGGIGYELDRRRPIRRHPPRARVIAGQSFG